MCDVYSVTRFCVLFFILDSSFLRLQVQSKSIRMEKLDRELREVQCEKEALLEERRSVEIMSNKNF